jgi:hypothetical protein
LSKIALDILSVPAISADPERLEALECLKWWLKASPLLDDDDDDDGEAVDGGNTGENIRECIIELN